VRPGRFPYWQPARSQQRGNKRQQHLDARSYRELSPQRNSPVIVAELAFDDTATADGVTVRSGSPVLALCRRLIEAGHDPRSRLEAYRGSVLCLRVQSIGEAARLEVSAHGTGFIAARERRAGSPISANGNSDPEPSDGGGS
jgi:hypothetical protein